MQIASQKIKKNVFANENLVYTGHKQDEDVNVVLIAYNENFYQKKKIKELGTLSVVDEAPCVRWINVDGIHDVDVVEAVGLQFGRQHAHPRHAQSVLDPRKHRRHARGDGYVEELLPPRGSIGAGRSDEQRVGDRYPKSHHDLERDLSEPHRDQITSKHCAKDWSASPDSE